MEFRIMTSGVSYRIQRKQWFWWRNMRMRVKSKIGYYNTDLFLDSRNAAVRWIREHYGTEVNIKVYWKPALIEPINPRERMVKAG